MTAPRQPLNPVEQRALLDELTLLLLDALPAGWQQLVIEYKAIGRHIDVGVGVRTPDRGMQVWEPPTEAWRLLARLRKGMYGEGLGTWFSARYGIDAPDTFTIDYNWRNEPVWAPAPPPAEAYTDELRRFPRTDENIPDWFRAKLPADGETSDSSDR
ncbi:hypothetical protein F0L68_40100 [Solihabitans fulvus]|uniref:DUF600 family protein n=1 Tax=Solihabitans fulvus TaxID=1892852 RepID=A0A5B2WB08_9PSEU|nr:hypothetical protein [Solihabitans fulvus]KAA2247666.1 hypothetical protein F0L68_40100 [Solihabitans fulvus]